jgi:hypothetical protein
MSFLDNSGDIILDAVLTDAGRERLAKGDGSFKITKFALGDDEINYETYDKNDSRGSAFYDLQILQTPILEAFTNNTSTMKSKLITITRNDILYLPVLKMFSGTGGGLAISTIIGLKGTVPLSVDTSTATSLGSKGSGVGVGNFYNALTATGPAVVVDQGLNTDAISASQSIPSDLFETSYSIQLDNRLLSLTNGDSATPVDESFIDDDQIAMYTVDYVAGATSGQVTEIEGVDVDNSSIAGPRGTRLLTGFKASIDVQTSTYLFTTLGGTVTVDSVPYYYIDTNVRITGLTTGYRIDVPLRLLKKQ